MAHLTDIDPAFPVLLEEAQRDGLVRVQHHPWHALSIANYTPKAQYDRVWNVVTKACRGLIWDENGTIVARPFAKFFNWDEAHVEKIPVGPVLVSQKFDGSLGVLYYVEGEPYIATRGSFSSEQATRGTTVFRRLVDEMGGFAPEPDKTYLFEIIYPENRIVVDYGGQERMVLIDVIDNATGKSDVQAFDRAPWFDIAHKALMPAGFHHTMVEMIGENEEGFVLYWPEHDLRVKMKGPEYVRLHKIITNCTARTVWEYLSSGQPLDQLLESVPDEFYQWVKQTATDLYLAYGEIEDDVRSQFNWAMAKVGWERFDREARKDFALLVKDFKYKSVLFRMWDDQPRDDIIWKILRPEHVRPFWAGEE